MESSHSVDLEPGELTDDVDNEVDKEQDFTAIDQTETNSADLTTEAIDAPPWQITQSLNSNYYCPHGDQVSRKRRMNGEQPNASVKRSMMEDTIFHEDDAVADDDEAFGCMQSEQGICEIGIVPIVKPEVEFDVIDDLSVYNDIMSDGEDVWSDRNNSDSEYDDEISTLLDEKLDEYRNKKAMNMSDGGIDEDESAFEEREKVVLKARGQDHFEVLPEGWIEVTHNSGMPVYLHKQTRVCTLSKPYFLGPGSARKHEVPITAIACLHYRRELSKEQSGAKDVVEKPQPESDEVVECCGDESKANLPSAKIETVQENTREKSIDFLQLREYCQRLFEFQKITVKRFRTWAGRRKHQKMLKQTQRPTLPLGTKLITCPLPLTYEKEEGGQANPRREFIMNPNGKSFVCILHEYVQHAMRVQPRYAFRELESSGTPYGATVVINDMEYGSGYGSSKKIAKSEAAKATLEILIPQMKGVNTDEKTNNCQQPDLTFFDEVRVEDPRVSELCAKAGQPSPYQILLECLKRNHGMGDTQIKFDMQTLKHQKNEFTLTVGKHVARVVCKNKRDGKQRASQAVLQALHPHIRSWGSLLRLYGKGSCKTLKEKKEEEQKITELQSRATANKPNVAILNKLREEMLKLREKKEVQPIGKFKPKDVEPPSNSGSNLKNVDL